MRLTESIINNIFCDWKRRDISSEEKAEILNEIIKETGLSERSLAKKFGVPHSTMHDWISNRQTKKYYEKKENEVFYVVDRLVFLLSKTDKLDDKTHRKIKELKSVLQKFEVFIID